MKKQYFISFQLYYHLFFFILYLTGIIIAQTSLFAEEKPKEAATASPETKKKQNPGFFGGEWYFSWGYNKEFWRPSDIHITQPALGNNFTIYDVRASDFPQWDSSGSVFTKELSEPQYSVRIGRFIDADHTLAIELNYDHTKYSSETGQIAHISGTISGQNVDFQKELDYNYFHYHLHNGANHIMLNLMKRIPLSGQINQTLSLAGIGRFGAGIMLPHSENSVFGHYNEIGPKSYGNYFGLDRGWWQLNGWTIGAEAGVRFVAYEPVYVEFTAKKAFASLSDVPVYRGTASQTLWMTEFILSVGFTLNGQWN